MSPSLMRQVGRTHGFFMRRRPFSGAKRQFSGRWRQKMRLRAQFQHETRESAHVLPEVFVIGFLLCAISIRALDLLSPPVPMNLDCQPTAADRALIACAI